MKAATTLPVLQGAQALAAYNDYIHFRLNILNATNSRDKESISTELHSLFDFNPLHVAVYFGDIAAIKKLLAAPCVSEYMTKKDILGFTPFMLASRIQGLSNVAEEIGRAHV